MLMNAQEKGVYEYSIERTGIKNEAVCLIIVQQGKDLISKDFIFAPRRLYINQHSGTVP